MTKMRTLTRGCAALVTATAMGLVAVDGAAHAAHATQPRPYELTHGHIDLFYVTYDDAADGLRLDVNDDTGIYQDERVVRAPEEVTIAIDETRAALEVPEGLPESYDFLGEPGDIVYSLPQSQDAQLPWPGWSTEDLVASLPDGVTLAAGSPVSLSVRAEGPGDVHTYMNSPGGQAINHYVDSSDGGPDVIPVAAHAHVHTEWAFSELGEYTLTVTPSARTSAGQTLTGPAANYLIRVGSDTAGAPTTTTMDLSSARQPYAAKEPVTAQVEVAAEQGGPASGSATLTVDGRPVGRSVALQDGRATLTLPAKLRPGRHRVAAEYLPDAGLAGSSTPATTVTVAKAPVKIAAVAAKPAARPRVSVTGSLPRSTGLKATGKVTLRKGTKALGTAKVTNGRATVRVAALPRGKHRLTARYAGTALIAAGNVGVTVTVRR